VYLKKKEKICDLNHKPTGSNKIILFSYMIKNNYNNRTNLKRKGNDKDDMHNKNALSK
jgi:hypothetical protein